MQAFEGEEEVKEKEKQSSLDSSKTNSTQLNNQKKTFGSIAMSIGSINKMSQLIDKNVLELNLFLHYFASNFRLIANLRSPKQR